MKNRIKDTVLTTFSLWLTYNFFTAFSILVITDSTKGNGQRLVGDVCFEEARNVASYITPVPGGVGPMTVTMLMKNTVQSAERVANRLSEMSWDIKCLPLSINTPVPR